MIRRETPLPGSEADTLYIGNPFTPLSDPYDGTIYVPDRFSQRVRRFARDGSPLGTYGRPRKGSGELRSAGAVFVLDDTTLAVHDVMLGDGRSSIVAPGTSAV